VPHHNEASVSWRRQVIGRSYAMRQVCDVIELVACKRCTVLISGETGTGKEVIAKAIHAASPRASRPMVAVNCTALPETLIEAELFGHSKGAFTGAHASRMGRFEQATKSTLFLDEIGDVPLSFQSKLLRVLQEQEVQRVGSSESIKLDVRVIAASNVDLETAVAERRFRDDLYYRLNVVPIHVPALRERREDVPLLVEHLLKKIQEAEHGPLKSISDEALDYLTNLDWPGNVRQLEHALQMAVALSGDRDSLQIADFAASRSARKMASASLDTPLLELPDGGLDFETAVCRFELSLLNQALAASGGNKARAANLLRIKRTTLLAKMKTLGERSELSCVS
jgi:transcriptional regulator with GAF, ATPase, and Fis domain